MTNKLNQLIKGTDLHIITTQDGDYISGFDEWNDVEKFCEKINKQYNCDRYTKVAEPVILYCRDGRDWGFKSNTDKPFNIDVNDACEAHNGFIAFNKSTFSSYEAFAEQEINPFIEGLDEEDDAEEIKEVVDKGKALWQEIQELNEREVLIIDECDNKCIDELNTLRFRHDVHNYMIAVSIEFPEQ